MIKAKNLCFNSGMTYAYAIENNNKQVHISSSIDYSIIDEYNPMKVSTVLKNGQLAFGQT